VLWARERAPTIWFSVVFILDSHLKSIKESGGTSPGPCNVSYWPRWESLERRRMTGEAQNASSFVSFPGSCQVEVYGKGDWAASWQGEEIFTVCFFFPWKDQPSFRASWIFLRKLKPPFSSFSAANGLVFTAWACPGVPNTPKRSKLSFAFGVVSPLVCRSVPGGDLVERWCGEGHHQKTQE